MKTEKDNLYTNTCAILVNCRERLRTELEHGDIQSNEDATKLIRLCKEIGEDFTEWKE